MSKDLYIYIIYIYELRSSSTQHVQRTVAARDFATQWCFVIQSYTNAFWVKWKKHPLWLEALATSKNIFVWNCFNGLLRSGKTYGCIFGKYKIHGPWVAFCNLWVSFAVISASNCSIRRAKVIRPATVFHCIVDAFFWAFKTLFVKTSTNYMKKEKLMLFSPSQKCIRKCRATWSIVRWCGHREKMFPWLIFWM